MPPSVVSAWPVSPLSTGSFARYVVEVVPLSIVAVFAFDAFEKTIEPAELPPTPR